jgi:hypothetical protein
MNEPSYAGPDPWHDEEGNSRPVADTWRILAECEARLRVSSLLPPGLVTVAADAPALAIETAKRQSRFVLSRDDRPFPPEQEARSHMLLRYLEEEFFRLRAMFGEAHAPEQIGVHWAPGPSGARARLQNFNSYDVLPGGRIVMRTVYSGGCKWIEFAGSAPKSDRRFSRHELGHVFLHECLPCSQDIQEAAALFCEQALEDPMQAACRNECYGKPTILEGSGGWAISQMATMKPDPHTTPPLYAAYFHHLLDVCGGRMGTLQAVLQESKRIASAQPAQTHAGMQLKQLPSLSAWLGNMDARLPGFAQAYLGSPLYEPIPEGKRTIWTPARRWGGILATQHLERNPNYCIADTEQEDLSYGHLRGDIAAATIIFPDYNLHLEITYEGSLVLEPQLVEEQLRNVSAASERPLPLRQGMRVILNPANLRSAIQLVWNAEAEAVLREDVHVL